MRRVHADGRNIATNSTLGRNLNAAGAQKTVNLLPGDSPSTASG